MKVPTRSLFQLVVTAFSALNTAKLSNVMSVPGTMSSTSKSPVLSVNW